MLTIPNEKDFRTLARAIANAKGERKFAPYLAKMGTFVYRAGRYRGKTVNHLGDQMRRNPYNIIPYPLWALRNPAVKKEFDKLQKAKQ